jgi:osomolarity two-component system response regulator SKN7
LSAANSITLLNELANTTQQQVQQLQEKIRDMSQSHRHLHSEIAHLHKIIGVQKQSQHELLNYLTYSIRERGTSASSGGTAGGNDGFDEMPQGLRQARDLLSVADRELERAGTVYGSQVESPSGMFSQPGSAGMAMPSDPMNDIARFPIYPVGQTVGIDPFHSDHINNIPYQLPSNPAVAYSAAPQPEPTITTPPTSNAQGGLSVWGRQRPKVLLVEDDQTCSRIGSKFLMTMDCTVDVAPDGVMAVTKVNNAPEYFDLIFMDIVMPGLDGASATDLIRQAAPTIPVIAMTSNIKPEDVQWYAEHGMNGVLAKPFTKDGMLRVLKQHLPHLLKEADTPPLHTPISGFAPVQHVASLGAALAGGPVKFESTPPAHSPSTTSTSWHSPGGFAQPSPTAGNMDSGFPVGMNGNGQLVAAQPASGIQRPGFSPDMPPPGGTNGGEDRPSKRPKVFGHSDSFGPR